MLTPEQRQLRKKYIGSSDAPAILGVDPYRSASDVYLEKTGQAEDFAGNDATDRGNLLEPVLLTWAARELGILLSRDVFVTSGTDDLLCANLDAWGIQDQQKIIVEAKSSNDPAQWGDEGTDEVPEKVIVQTHHAMYVSGARIAYVPVILPGFRSFDFRMYKVDRNEDLAQAIAHAGREFMRQHVQLRVPPSDFRPSIEVLKRMRREPSKTVPITPELADRLVLARAACKLAEEDKEEVERVILATLMDAEAGDPGDGRILTYLPSTRKAYTVKETTFRTLRVKPAKGNK